MEKNSKTLGNISSPLVELGAEDLKMETIFHLVMTVLNSMEKVFAKYLEDARKL